MICSKCPTKDLYLFPTDRVGNLRPRKQLYHKLMTWLPDSDLAIPTSGPACEGVYLRLKLTLMVAPEWVQPDGGHSSAGETTCPQGCALSLSFYEANRDVIQRNWSTNVRASFCERKFTSVTFTELSSGQGPNSLGEQRGEQGLNDPMNPCRPTGS